MNDRQKRVLAAIVEEYTKNAIPVGSQHLLERYGFEVSSATLRNDMIALEKAGLLYQPHTSSGRIPTDEGFRFYVEEVMPDETLSIAEQKRLQKELLSLRAKHVRLGRSTAKLLSTLSGNLAVAGLADKDGLYDFGMKELLGNPEFRDLDELCLLVETLDSLDEKFDIVLQDLGKDETRIFIGKENPIAGISNCSMMVSPYENEEGQGILAIIGPKRMKYAKNKSLLEHMRKLLSVSLVLVIVMRF